MKIIILKNQSRFLWSALLIFHLDFSAFFTIKYYLWWKGSAYFLTLPHWTFWPYPFRWWSNGTLTLEEGCITLYEGQNEDAPERKRMCTTHASTAFTTKDTELKAPHLTSKGQEVLDVVNDLHQVLPHRVILILNSLSIDSNNCLCGVCASLEKKATEKAAPRVDHQIKKRDLAFGFQLHSRCVRRWRVLFWREEQSLWLMGMASAICNFCQMGFNRKTSFTFLLHRNVSFCRRST